MAHSSDLARFIWEKKSLVNRLPFVYELYRLLMNLWYQDGTTVVIRHGPIAGYKWRHYQAYQPWMAMGMYEPHVVRFIYEKLRPGDVFYDIGANAGYFTLVAAKAVGPHGEVIAFDPVPQNARTIVEQLELNDLVAYCRVEPLAVSDQCGAARFIVTEVNANSHLDETDDISLGPKDRSIDVTTVTLDAYVRDHPPPPTLVKIDIEGAEVAALRGAQQLLHSDCAPKLLVSTHGSELERQAKEILSAADYSFANVQGFSQMVYATPKQKP